MRSGTTRPSTLKPYLAGSGLPQVFNFQLILSRWDASELRGSIDAIDDMAGGARAPWVIGNHDVARPVTRYAANKGGRPNEAAGLPRVGDPEMAAGFRRARAAALLLLALPGSAYIYQGEELGLPEVVELPDEARQDPTFRRSGPDRAGPGRLPGPAAVDQHRSLVRLLPDPGEHDGTAPWLPQPSYWGQYSVARQLGEPDSFLSLYRDALKLRRTHPALGYGPGDATGVPAQTRPPGRGWSGWKGRPARCSSGVSPDSCFAANPARHRAAAAAQQGAAGQRPSRGRQAAAGHRRWLAR